MTDEEKVNDIYDICLERKSITCNRKMGEETCINCKTYKMYKLGLEECRKEILSEEVIKNLKENTSVINSIIMGKLSKKCEQLEKENTELKEKIEKLKNDYKKQRNKRIDELQKENAKLKQQIEKMKCCCKCKYYQGALCECTNQVYVLKASGKCNEWELEE